MKAMSSTGITLLLTAALSSGGEPSRHEAVTKELLTNVEKITMALAAIKDEETSKAATPVLRGLAKGWESIRKKAEDLPPPSAEEKAQLEKKFKSSLESAQKKLFLEVARVRQVDGGPNALATLNQVLGKKVKEKKSEPGAGPSTK